MSKPLAFVLMPFSTDFDSIFNLFLAGALAEAGYDVRRADSMDNQQNILKDIIDGIISADLVVADLTGDNANVFYEVGIAHALRRKVVLLTQDIEAIPFDLRPYRTLPYTTHFADIDEARRRLVDIAKGALDHTVSFSNPVQDFAGSTITMPSERERAGDVSEEQGILDYLVTLEDSLQGLTSVAERIQEETVAIGSATTQTGERFASSHSSMREKLNVARIFAKKLSSYADAIRSGTDDYREHLSRFENVIEPIVTGLVPVQSDEDLEALAEFLNAMNAVADITESTRQSQSELASNVQSLPNIERQFMRARNRAAHSLQQLAELLDKTVAVLNRAETLGRRYLLSMQASHQAD